MKTWIGVGLVATALAFGASAAAAAGKQSVRHASIPQVEAQKAISDATDVSARRRHVRRYYRYAYRSYYRPYYPYYTPYYYPRPYYYRPYPYYAPAPFVFGFGFGPFW